MTATLRAPARARTNQSGTRPAQRRVTPKASPQLRVVDEKARRRHHARSVIIRAFLVIAGFVILGAFIFQSFVSQGQIRLRTLTVDTQAAQAEYQSERLAYAEASAPSKIASKAASLGLIRGPVPRFISVDGVVPSSSSGAFKSRSSTLGEDWERVKPHLEARP